MRWSTCAATCSMRSTRTRSPPRSSARRPASSAGCGRRCAQRPEEFLDLRTVEAEGVDVAAQDFLAGMTDRYAVRLFEELFIPKPWMEIVMLSTDDGSGDPRPASRDGDRRRSAGRPGLLHRAARPAARQEDRQLRQPQRLSLLLRHRARRAGHDLDDVPLQGIRRARRHQGRGPGRHDRVSRCRRDRSSSGGIACTKAAWSSSDIEAHFGEPAIAFNDPSGLRFELIATDRDARAPWTAIVGSRAPRSRGLHSVQMMVRQAQPSVDFLTGVLGYRWSGRRANRTRVAAGGDAAGPL